MSALTPTIREALNNAVLQELPGLFQQIGLGDFLCYLMDQATPTQAAAAVTSNRITLSNAARRVLDVVCTTGTVTGRKKLLIGPTTGNGAIVPQTGEVVWDGPGTSTLLFAVADGVTAADFFYMRNDAVGSLSSIGLRLPTENDSQPRES